MAASTMSNNNALDDFLAPLQPPPRSLSPVRSHYRPFSTIISPPPDSSSAVDASPSKLRRTSGSSSRNRPLSSAFPNMGFLKSNKHKGKEKEKEDSGFFRTLKPKKSMNTLVVLHEEGPPLSSTPPSIYTPSLALSFAESSTAGYSTPGSSSSSSTFIPGTSSSNPNSPAPTISNFDYTDRFEPKENWITRKHRLKLHPYGAEAPYMQSYDSVALSIDRYMHILLRRLNANGTPSFYNYAKHNKHPPTSVLDLGCGQGHWILDAASSWPDAQIVGLDLVDVTLPDVHKIEHLKFVRGNFIRYPLPFPPNSFDLVRIANLSLAIPTDRWEYVLSEVYRVLQVGGRLELIDDAMDTFPYGKETSTPSPRMRPFPHRPNRRTRSSTYRELSSFDSFDDEITPDDDINEDQDGEMKDDDEWEREQPVEEKGAVQSVSILDDSDIEAEVEAREAEQSPVVDDDGSMEYPSSPETSVEADGLFVDVEDSSSASSLQDVEDHPDSKQSSFLQPPSLSSAANRLSIRPLPPRRPLPPIPVSPGPGDLTFAPITKPEDEDDLVTPTKLDITFPTPATVLDSEPTSPLLEEDEPNSPVSPIFISEEEPASSPFARKSLPNGLLVRKTGKHWKLSSTTCLRTSMDAFGSENVRKVPTMHLKLAPPELEDLIPREKWSMFRTRSYSKATELGVPFEDDDDEFSIAKKPTKEKKLKKDKDATLKESTARSRANTTESVDGRSSSESVVIPNALSAKAAGRLGITYTALAAATKSAQTPPDSSSSPVTSVHSNRSSGSVTSVSRLSDEVGRNSYETQTSLEGDGLVPIQQSPGLVLLPSTFIPIPPAELEMHACKHMHTLLSCKPALYDWLLYNEDGSESDCISEEVLRDAFFEYDSFRRQRLNWPSQVAETHTNDYNYRKNIEIPFEGPKSANRNSTFTIDSRTSSTSEVSIGPYNRHDLTHVRTIRVYLAVKMRKLVKN
ncbi:hypothetical protein BT96DRAFT_970148 [Gymnopus androsaceus JB14]|uniref:Methyltransferase domain-containing protein n=1 Tax=Gymnopus androsaceus JB14 TaxID=1447944 RepID=A0A6A4IIX4_9AGAR|nr:hypothetical protein BT96DRAFT_970148 [Gymnopus androsaceus JB14]